MLIASLERAFIGNSQGLYKSLIHKDRRGWTVLTYAAHSKNNAQGSAIFIALEKAFDKKSDSF